MTEHAPHICGCFQCATAEQESEIVCEGDTHRYAPAIYFDLKGVSAPVTCVCGVLTVTLSTESGDVMITGQTNSG